MKRKRRKKIKQKIRKKKRKLKSSSKLKHFGYGIHMKFAVGKIIQLKQSFGKEIKL